MVLECSFFKVLDIAVWNRPLQQVGKGLHIGLLGLGYTLNRPILPFIRPAIFQVIDLCRGTGRNNNLFLRILNAFFFKPLLAINLYGLDLDGLLDRYLAGLAALEQLILHDVVSDISALF